MRNICRLAPIIVTVVVGLTAMTGANARPIHDHVRIAEKMPKTHRILAGSKSVRINDAGEVITDEKP